MKKLQKFGDDVGSEIDNWFGCLMLIILGLVILTVILGACSILGVSVFALFSIN